MVTMSTMGSVALVLASLQLGPASAPAPSFSPGVGYTVSRLQREADGRAAPATAQTSGATKPASLVPHLPPPPSDLARVQGSPRARGLHTAAAVATQLAMVVAGIIAVREQREQLRRERERDVQPYRPYR